ncbi:hypothetical protein [Candidatus Nesciobacter abundans]|uniref:Outer membrane protein beta-barrel domain-containing protein n=1 Tax=Candidatus Nesciobacter abundans TaxID=2601668 RepID=A0A5C0UHG9_9PROT|nr:hypothetical protein [Candidatus Nesciobacter abundans]QEK39167.1 hypothetical protein FZC36_01840 [Candidatus Nesciobacter abundans]
MNIRNKYFALCVLFSFVSRSNTSSLELETGFINTDLYNTNKIGNNISIEKLKLTKSAGIVFDTAGMKNRFKAGIRVETGVVRFEDELKNMLSGFKGFVGLSLNFRPFSSFEKLYFRVYPGLSMINISSNNSVSFKIGASVGYELSKNLYSFVSFERIIEDQLSAFNCFKLGIAIRTIK